ncbi:hypothetical protein AAEU33_13860 [Chryseobacterium sp. Chry.R1]|uniref:hypothetical protein n=1 Tax=Chryseobacterium sp. Chry.R1 TaxID=3139392 RepID=UPI0031FA1609
MENNLPKIYSKKAIFGFSVLMSTLFGGILLYQNLIDIKKKREAYIVLGLSILITIVTIVIVNIPEEPKSSLAYVFGAAGGGLLSNYFVPNYFPDEEHYPKKEIWKPLIIAAIITVSFVGLIIYAGSLENT